MSKILVDTIDTRSGTSTLTLGSSNANTLSLNSSITTLPATLTNTPAFFINKQSDQTITSSTYTLITFDTEIIDTDNAFASNKFTVPTGKGGKYQIGSVLFTDSNSGSNYSYSIIQMRVNGATTHYHIMDFRDNPVNQMSVGVNAILNLSASDYVEVYCQIADTSGDPKIDTDGSTLQSYFYGYRLIGV